MELAQQRTDVAKKGTFGELDLPGDLAIGEASGQLQQNAALADAIRRPTTLQANRSDIWTMALRATTDLRLNV